MGCAHGGGVSSETKEINKVLLESRKKDASTTKVLLLGSGESGKTTFLKQILYFNPNDKQREDMIKGNTNAMKKNIMNRINNIISELEELEELPKDDSEVNQAIEVVRGQLELTPEMGAAIALLWKRSYVQELEKTKYDCYEYFFKAVERISANEYVPTRDDILRVRVKTSGVQFFEINDQTGGTNWMFIDVSGQRSERRKWIHAFEGVRAVIYLSSLPSYDLTLEENDKVNRMEDELTLFESVSSIQYLPNLWIFFQNKSDLFRDKIARSPISDHFPDIDKSKETDFDYAVSFFRTKFQSSFHRGPITFHTTCALDSNGFEKIYKSIQTQILQATLKDCGLV